MEKSMQLDYLDDTLTWSDLCLEKVAQRFGTPAFLYNIDKVICETDRMLEAAGDNDLLICFALKSNNNYYLLRQLAEKGIGADVVSGAELNLAVNAGIPVEKIVYAGVGKTEEEIRYALEQNIFMFNVESVDELKLINKVSSGLNKKAPVAFRVNPDIDAESHPYITTGLKQNKFGIGIETALEVFQYAKTMPFIDVKGIHVHIGSQIQKLSPFVDTVQSVRQLVLTLKSNGINIPVVDFGGGLGHDYYSDMKRLMPESLKQEQNVPREKCITIEDWISVITSGFRDTGIKVVVEPGRSLTAGAGILLIKALYLKENHGKKFIVCDTGMNDLVRPSLYQAYHGILPCRRSGGSFEFMDIVGPICESTDFFAKNRCFPHVVQGDILAVLSAGAYGSTLSSNYNMHLRPPEIVIHRGGIAVARRREVFSDLTETTIDNPDFISKKAF